MYPNRLDSKTLHDGAAALRILRAFRDWHQAELAEAAGIDIRTLQRYETGDLEVPDDTQTQLMEAAGLPPFLFRSALLPIVRILRTSFDAERELYGGLNLGDEEEEEGQESPEEIADRISQEVTQSVRVVVLEYFLALEREEKEREANAWRPKPGDREAVPDLLARLAQYDLGDREFLIEEASPFQSWAFAEHLAESAAANSPHVCPPEFGSALDRARMALKVAEQVAGPETWKSRVRGYCQAFQGQALREAGDAEGAARAAEQAEQAWNRGEDQEGVLVEETYATALRAAAEGALVSSGSHRRPENPGPNAT